MTTLTAPAQMPGSRAIRGLPRPALAQINGQNRVLALLARAQIRATVKTRSEDEVEPWPALRVEFDSRYGRIGIAPTWEDAPLARLCGEDGRPDLATAAEAMRRAEPLLCALEDALGSPLRPRGLAPMPPDDRIELALRTDQGPGARLDAPVSVLEVLPEPVWHEPPSGILMWALNCRIELARQSFSAARLAGLRAGDVLLPGPAGEAKPVVRVLTPDGRMIEARLDAAARALQFGLPSAPEPSMPSESDASSQPSSAPPWTELPVELSFELPRTTVALGVLAGLQPGAVIPVGTDAQALSVTVYNGGREVGRGELIALGDGLGVRLLTPLGECR